MSERAMLQDLGLWAKPGMRVVLPDALWLVIADYRTHREVTGFAGDYPPFCVTVKTEQTKRALSRLLRKPVIFSGEVQPDIMRGDSGEEYRLITGTFKAITP